MGSERCCCCHIMTNAAVVGILQVGIIVLVIASAGTFLDRWRLWDEAETWEANNQEFKRLLKNKAMQNATVRNKVMELVKYGEINEEKLELLRGILEPEPEPKSKSEPEPTGEPESEPKPQGEPGGESLMEVQLAQEIAVCAMWLVALFAYAAAFKYYRAVFVLPNYIAQIISIVFTISSIVGMIVALVNEIEKNEKDEREYYLWFISTLLAFYVVFVVVEIYFVVIIHKFYSYLKEYSGKVFPGPPPYDSGHSDLVEKI